MLMAMIRSHGASPGRPTRWITASAPALASVTAARSVTEAKTTSSLAPGGRPTTGGGVRAGGTRGGGGTTSSRRSVRPGRASRVRSMDPIRPEAPVIRIVGTPTDITRSPLAAGSAGSSHPRAPPAQVAGHGVLRRLGRGELRDVGGDVRRPRAGVLVLVEAGVLPRERRAGPVLPLPGVDRRGQ